MLVLRLNFFVCFTGVCVRSLQRSRYNYCTAQLTSC